MVLPRSIWARMACDSRHEAMRAGSTGEVELAAMGEQCELPELCEGQGS